jgi:hypothetical protein
MRAKSHQPFPCDVQTSDVVGAWLVTEYMVLLPVIENCGAQKVPPPYNKPTLVVGEPSVRISITA